MMQNYYTYIYLNRVLDIPFMIALKLFCAYER